MRTFIDNKLPIEPKVNGNKSWLPCSFRKNNSKQKEILRANGNTLMNIFLKMQLTESQISILIIGALAQIVIRHVKGFPAVDVSKINFIPIMILVISTLHYHTLFSIPGQMLFGYLLTRKNFSTKNLI